MTAYRLAGLRLHDRVANHKRIGRTHQLGFEFLQLLGVERGQRFVVGDEVLERREVNQETVLGSDLPRASLWGRLLGHGIGVPCYGVASSPGSLGAGARHGRQQRRCVARVDYRQRRIQRCDKRVTFRAPGGQRRFDANHIAADKRGSDADWCTCSKWLAIEVYQHLLIGEKAEQSRSLIERPKSNSMACM